MKSAKINLALQGGGAHGAFTWGVLDRLLDESWLSFDGVSGTSAGAMNAVMFAEGWRKDSAAGAKAQLSAFWEAVGSEGLGFELPQHIEQTVTKWWLTMFQHLSPYDVNILDINPLRDIVNEQVDFIALQQAKPFALFIAATAVDTGKLRLFREHELTTDHVLASACLPNIHKAIEINDTHYWDGGFAGNPAVFPLIYEHDTEDTLIVLLQPLSRESLPTTSSAISERISELTFQSNFMREMRAIANMKTLTNRPSLFLGKAQRKIKRARFHMVTNQTFMSLLDNASKYNNRMRFLESLRNAGSEAAERWLNEHADAIGKRDSCDIHALFE